MGNYRATIALLLGLLTILVAPGVAQALGDDCLVDDPSLIKIPPNAQAHFDREEAKFQKWLAGQEASASVTAAGGTADIVASAIGSYSFCDTTSHKQIRNDYCGPATCATIDHYLCGADKHWSQNQWAAYTYNGQHLWTDANGASMWVMAVGLRAKTGRGFAYTSGNTRTTLYDRTSYSLTTYHRCVAYGMRIDGNAMNYYIYNHDGHIVTGRGYDFRDVDPGAHKIYLDDSYPENEYQPGGGDTYGRRTYPKQQIADAVVSSANQQMIY